MKPLKILKYRRGRPDGERRESYFVTLHARGNLIFENESGGDESGMQRKRAEQGGTGITGVHAELLISDCTTYQSVSSSKG